jgi:hypothetical protein
MILAYPLTQIGFPQCRIVKLDISYVTSLRRIQIGRYTKCGRNLGGNCGGYCCCHRPFSSACEVDGTELPRWPTLSGCLDACCETS